MDNKGLRHLLVQRYMNNRSEPETLFIDILTGLKRVRLNVTPVTYIYVKNGAVFFKEDLEQKKICYSRRNVSDEIRLSCGYNEEDIEIVMRSLIRKVKQWRDYFIINSVSQFDQTNYQTV